MNTSQKITPIASLSSAEFLLSGQNATLQAGTSQQAPTQPSNQRAQILTTVAPTLKTAPINDPVDEMLNGLFDEFASTVPKNLSFQAKKTLTAFAQALDQSGNGDIKSLLSTLSKTVSTSLPKNLDPQTQALVDKLTTLINQATSPNRATDTTQMQAELDSIFTDLFQQIAAKNPSSTGLLQQLSQLLKSGSSNSVTTATTPLTDASTPTQASMESNNDAIIKMISLLLKMAIDISDLQSDKASFQQNFLSKLKEFTQAEGDANLNKIYEANQQMQQAQQQQQHQSFWQELLGALAIVVTFVFLGPVAAVVAGALFALQAVQVGNPPQSIMDKMFSGIDNPTLKIIAKLAFCVGVAVIGGGLAAGLESTVAPVAEEGAATAATTATDVGGVNAFDEEGIEMVNLNRNLAASEDTIAEDTATSSEDTVAAKTPGRTFGGSFLSNTTNLGLQSFFSVNVITDIVNAIVNPTNDPKKKETAMWWSFAFNLIAMIASMGLAAKGANSNFMNNISSKAENSKAYSLLNGFMKVASNPILLGVLTTAFAGMSGYYGILTSQTYQDMANNKKDQGAIEGDLDILTALSSELNQEMQRDSAAIEQMLNNLASSTSDTTSLTLQGVWAAQALAKA